MPTVTGTFFKATFVLVTFVHIRNISAVTDRILTKHLGPDFFQTLTFLIKIFLPIFCLIQFFWDLKNFVNLKYLDLIFCLDTNFFEHIFWTQYYSDINIFLTQHYSDINIFQTHSFLDLKFLLTQSFVKAISFMQEFWVHKFFVTNKIFLGPHFFNNFLKNTFFLSNCSPRMKCMTDFEFGTKTKLLKLKPHPPSPGWLSTIPRLFTYHPRDSQPSNSTRSLTLAQPSLLIN